MSHKTRVERHLIVDILAGVLGAAFTMFCTTGSIPAVLLAAAASVVLFITERKNIQEEDLLEEPATFAPLPVNPDNLFLSAKDVNILRKKAEHPATENLTNEQLAPYIAGLEDGAATTAQWILGQTEVSE